MTDAPKTYATGQAFWRAAIDRAKAAALVTGRSHQELLRQLAYERLLARVFAAPDESWVVADDRWVLKGGTALLARIEDARHSRDVDLLHRLGDIDHAVDHLREVLDRDLADHLAFTVTKIVTMGESDRQAGVDGRRIGIAVYVGGTKKVEQFHIDLVTGSLMTGDPQEVLARAPFEMPGLQRPKYRLYPIVDHVADKLCATETEYSGLPSSRVRDLVDLVVIARTQTMDLTALHHAIVGERHKRALPHRTTFATPDAWATTYPRESSRTGHCEGIDFIAATALAARLIEPALIPSAQEATWDPLSTAWVHP